MAVDQKVSELPAASSIGLTDALVLNQGGATKTAAVSLLKAALAGTQSFPVLAQAMAPSVSGGCAPLARIATTANHPDIASLDFDNTTQEFAQFSVTMPKNWDEGTITAKFKWSHSSTTTNYGVKWGIQAVAVSDGDSIDAAYGTAQEVADTGGATNVEYTTAATSAITIAGSPAAEDRVYFRIYRLPSDAADTLAVDARLHEVKIYFTIDTIDEA